MSTLLLRNLLVPAYGLGVSGALLQIAGGYWDVSWHGLGLVETFFTLPHLILYTGVALVLFSAFLGLLMRFLAFRTEPSNQHLVTGLLIAAIGGGLQVVAGPSDFYWHAAFGFDPFLFTPAHALLISGIIINGLGMTIGSTRLLQAYRANINLKIILTGRWLQFLSVIALATLWLDLNTLVYLLTDIDGIAYTFQLGDAFVQTANPIAFSAGVVLVSLTGTLVIFSTKKILPPRGSVISVALISAGVSALANLSFRALILAGTDAGMSISNYIPVYLSFLVPVALFDLLVTNSWTRPRMIVAAALLSPFASFLDGWFSVALWTNVTGLIPLLIIPLLLSGLAAGAVEVKFSNMLLSKKILAF